MEGQPGSTPWPRAPNGWEPWSPKVPDRAQSPAHPPPGNGAPGGPVGMGHQLPRRVCHPRALPGAGRVLAGRALPEVGGAGPPGRTERKPASLGWGGLGRSCHLSPHCSCPPYVETPPAGIHASQRGRPARSQRPSKAPVHKIRFVWRRILPGPRGRVEPSPR